jgi:hypothetical protein
MALVMMLGCLAVCREFEPLFALPASRMGGEGFVFEVERDVVVVGFHGEVFANRPRRRRIGVPVKLDGEIGVALGHRLVAAIGQEFGQGPHGVGAKTVPRPPSGGAMHAGIGHLVAPVVGLGLRVIGVGKGTQRPEVVPDIVDGALFDFACNVGLPHVTGNGGDVEGAQKLQELVVKAHHGAVMFDDRGEHIVVVMFLSLLCAYAGKESVIAERNQRCKEHNELTACILMLFLRVHGIEIVGSSQTAPDVRNCG